jgi:hypothetical protein
MTAYVEQDCIVTHEGRSYEAGGAVVTDQYVVGYTTNDMTGITTWHGEHLGTARVVSSWAQPNSWIGSRQYQVQATINGTRYSGRTMGGGMIWRGRRMAGQ